MSFATLESLTFETTTCWKCGIVFALPASMMKNRREDKESFFCPNGHSGAFVNSEVDRLRRQLEAQRQLTESARAEAARKDRQLIAAKATNTKIKNRVANGVCPCCNRTFQNLGRHMAGKHPDWKAQDVG